MVEIINELTKHSTDSTTNFLKSLKFIDNAFIIAKFFKKLNEEGKSYHIIKGFDYNEEDNNFSQFKVVYFVSDDDLENEYANIKITKISNFYVLTLI